MAELFPEEPSSFSSQLTPRLKELSGKGIHFGTSSWKYEGWVGTIYQEDRYKTRGKFSKKKFEENCLTEYARVFPTVCGDFAFYQFPSDEYWQRLFSMVPEDFKFALKVPEDITVAIWPKHARYGKNAGNKNDNFLDAHLFQRLFTDRLKPYSHQTGPIIFEFGTFNKSVFATPEEFQAALGPFLSALPEGFDFAIEIRNQEFLTSEHLRILADYNVAHVFNAWTRMPGLDEQGKIDDAYTANFTVIRALLKRGRSYEAAVKTFEPYERIQEVQEGAREGITEIVTRSVNAKRRVFAYINNRLEGYAPGTIESIIERL
jgi:uncharacterized protein YecE (DUF72 family)